MAVCNAWPSTRNKDMIFCLPRFRGVLEDEDSKSTWQPFLAFKFGLLKLVWIPLQASFESNLNLNSKSTWQLFPAFKFGVAQITIDSYAIVI